MARKTENSGPSVSAQEALEFHAMGRPGKLEIVPTKPMATQRDLSLAYSPGVAVPVRAIAEDPSRAFDYTTRGNMVAVISNGTAILGLGNLGALASKPVMEGKAVLFKRFADVDSIDLEVDTEDADEFINCVRFLGPSFGGINLEDIKAPECFIIEQRLRELMDIPVFHDDQHGTAIISAAGLINALEITGRDMKTTKMVCNGAGAAGIACIELMKAMGFSPENIILCDTKGVVYQGRTEGMNQWKSAHAVKTEARTLGRGTGRRRRLPRPFRQGRADHQDGAVDGEEPDHLRHGQSRSGDHAGGSGRDPHRCHHGDRPLGLSEPGQQRARLPLHLPRRARCAGHHHQRRDEDRRRRALAELAREDVPDDVAAAYQGNRPKFGPNYIIPVPFDPRLISAIPLAVAKAAMESGVARKPILDLDRYAQELSARRDPIASTLQRIYDRVRRQPKRIVFAEGEEEQVMRAAVSYVNQKLGTAILLGRDDVIKENAKHAGIELNKQGIEIINARLSRRNGIYTDYLYERMQRKGFLFRDCQRLINNDRNHFAACMVALGDADGMVTGVTRNYSTALDDIRRIIDAKPGPPRHRRLDRARAGPDGVRRRHRRARHAQCRADRRHRRGGGRLRPPHGLRAAARHARLLHLRPSAGRALRARAGGGAHPRQAPRRFRI